MMDTTTIVPATKTLDNRGSDCATGFLKLLEMFDGLAEGEALRILSSIQFAARAQRLGRSRRARDPGD